MDLYFYGIPIKHGILAPAATGLPVGAAPRSAISGSATSRSSVTTHLTPKASNRKITDFDFTYLAESPDSRQPRKRAFDAVAERNSVEVKAAKLTFSQKPKKRRVSRGRSWRASRRATRRRSPRRC